MLGDRPSQHLKSETAENVSLYGPIGRRERVVADFADFSEAAREKKIKWSSGR